VLPLGRPLQGGQTGFQILQLRTRAYVILFKRKNTTSLYRRRIIMKVRNVRH